MNRITITLDEYLSGGYTLPDNIKNFITLNIDENNYNIEDMFVIRNKYKEIGSETEELFKHNLTALIDEALAQFNPQLKLLSENYNKLMERTTTEENTSYSVGNDDNKAYLNPANTNAEKLTNRNKNERDFLSVETKKRMFGWLDNNPKVLELSLVFPYKCFIKVF